MFLPGVAYTYTTGKETSEMPRHLVERRLFLRLCRFGFNLSEGPLTHPILLTLEFGSNK